MRLALGAERIAAGSAAADGERRAVARWAASSGSLLAFWLLAALRAADLPLPFPSTRISPSTARVLGFTAVLAVADRPALRARARASGIAPDVVPVLKNENVPAGAGRRGLAAVVLRFASCSSSPRSRCRSISLVAAGLFLRSLNDARRIDTGFRDRGVLVMTFNLGREATRPERGQLFYDQVRRAAVGAARRRARGDRAERAAGRRFPAQRLSRRAGHDDARSRARAGELGRPGLLRDARHPAPARTRLRFDRRAGARRSS